MSQDTVPASPPGQEPAVRDPIPPQIRQQVAAYWRDLGIAAPELAQSLADECLARAGRRVAPKANEELLRRALEEAQRRFDAALGRALSLPAGQPHALSAARAAFLLTRDGLAADGLFQSGETAAEVGSRIRAVLPHPTPPESALTMTEAPLRFWLFRSPHR